MRIHFHQTAFTRCETRRGEIQIGRIALASASNERIVHCNGRVGSERERYFPVRRRIAPHHFFFPDKIHAARFHCLFDRLGDFAIEE